MITDKDKKCPVTGLPILRKTEWTDLDFDTDHYSITFILLGDNIILANAKGKGNSYTTECALAFRDKIADEFIPKEKQFIYIDNLREYKQFTLDTNNTYIKMSIEQTRLKGIIFLGVSTLLKTLIKIGNMAFSVNYTAKIAKNYREAILLALEIEKNSSLDRNEITDKKSDSKIKDGGPSVLETNEICNLPVYEEMKWSNIKLTDRYSVDYKIIGNNIIVITPIGDCQTDGVPLVINKYYEFLKEKNLESSNRINIWDYSKVVGYPPQKARQQFVHFMKEESTKGFLLGYIAINVPVALKIFINVASHIYSSNYPILYSNDYESAVKTSLKLLDGKEDYQEQIDEVFDDIDKREYSRKDIAELSNDVLQFLSKLSWDNEEILTEKFSKIKDHPFKNIFEAISIIKWDFDSILEERNKIVEELEEANRKIREVTDHLIQNEKLTVMGELSAGIAHELKQPMNNISIISQSLLRNIKRKTIEEDELENDINDINGYVRKMTEIIDNMRYLFRKSHDIPKEVIDVNQLLDDISSLIIKQLQYHEIQLQTDYADPIEKIRCNIIQIEQVFLNIINNARDVLNSCDMENKVITLKTLQGPGENVTVEISDNGPGIDEETLDKIFESFYTTKEAGKGTGLGLSLSKRIIKEHDGDIQVSSSRKRGATFRIILPV